MAAAVLVVAGCGSSSKGSQSGQTTPGSSKNTSASSTSAGAGTAAQTVSVTFGGYPYKVSAGRLSSTPELHGVGAPPGQDYVTFTLVVRNPATDRTEPLTAFDQGGGQAGYGIYLAAPLGASFFNCAPSPDISPPTLPTSPPVCNADNLTVTSDPDSATGNVPAGGEDTITYETGSAAPAGLDLTKLNVYFWDESRSPPTPPALIPRPS